MYIHTINDNNKFNCIIYISKFFQLMYKEIGSVAFILIKVLKKIQFRMNMPLFLALWGYDAVRSYDVNFFLKPPEIVQLTFTYDKGKSKKTKSDFEKINIQVKVRSFDYLLPLYRNLEARIWNNSDNKVSMYNIS